MTHRPVATVGRPTAGGEPLGPAVASFLAERDLAPSSRRVYVLALHRLLDRVDADTPLAEVSPRMLAEFMTATYPHLAPASYNRVVATLASLFAYTTRQGWTPTSPATGLERRRPRSDRATPARARAIPAAELLAFLDADHPLLEKTLWWLLYETAARAGEVLALNIADLDLGCPVRRGRRQGRRSHTAATTGSSPAAGGRRQGRRAARPRGWLGRGRARPGPTGGGGVPGRQPARSGSSPGSRMIRAADSASADLGLASWRVGRLTCWLVDPYGPRAMPMESLTDAQKVAGHGRFDGVPSRADLERFFFLDGCRPRTKPRSCSSTPRQHRRWVLRATALGTPGIRRDGVPGGAALRPTRPLVAQPVALQPEPSSRPCTGQVITTLGSVVIEAVASRYRLEP